MNFTTITVGQLTYAIKTKKILQGKKINARLVKVDSSKSKKGCEYGVEFPSAFFYDVISELKSLNIEYNVYKSDKTDI